MAGLALSIEVLGGVATLVAGLVRQDWVAAGIGIALIGIGLLLWELITTVVERSAR